MIDKKWKKQLHEQIGAIVQNHANIEHGLSVWVNRLISDDANVGFIITSEMSYKSLINALYSLIIYRAKHVEQIKPYESRVLALVKRINKVEQERNKYAHSSVFSLDGGICYTRVKFTAKGNQGLRLLQEDIKIESLEKINKEQEEILEELSELFHLTVDKQRSMPKKVREILAKQKNK